MSLRRPSSTLVVSVLIAVGLVLIGFGLLSARTGRSAQGLPTAIELVRPARGDTQVLRQDEIRVELQAGYTGLLIIDGLELPVVNRDEITVTATPEPGEVVEIPKLVVYDPANFSLSYQPQEGAPVERLEPGTHRVTAVFWKVTETRAQAMTYTWEFDVVL